jgi:hypothetical protein
MNHHCNNDWKEGAYRSKDTNEWEIYGSRAIFAIPFINIAVWSTAKHASSSAVLLLTWPQVSFEHAHK